MDTTLVRWLYLIFTVIISSIKMYVGRVYKKQ